MATSSSLQTRQSHRNLNSPGLNQPSLRSFTDLRASTCCRYAKRKSNLSNLERQRAGQLPECVPNVQFEKQDCSLCDSLANDYNPISDGWQIDDSSLSAREIFDFLKVEPTLRSTSSDNSLKEFCCRSCNCRDRQNSWPTNRVANNLLDAARVADTIKDQQVRRVFSKFSGNCFCFCR